jgi:hypothetical protein
VVCTRKHDEPADWSTVAQHESEAYIQHWRSSSMCRDECNGYDHSPDRVLWNRTTHHNSAQTIIGVLPFHCNTNRAQPMQSKCQTSVGVRARIPISAICFHLGIAIPSTCSTSQTPSSRGQGMKWHRKPIYKQAGVMTGYAGVVQVRAEWGIFKEVCKKVLFQEKKNLSNEQTYVSLLKD